jgi:hypothetical protein
MQKKAGSVHQQGHQRTVRTSRYTISIFSRTLGSVTINAHVAWSVSRFANYRRRTQRFCLLIDVHCLPPLPPRKRDGGAIDCTSQTQSHGDRERYANRSGASHKTHGQTVTSLSHDGLVCVYEGGMVLQLIARVELAIYIRLIPRLDLQTQISTPETIGPVVIIDDFVEPYPPSQYQASSRLM